MYLLISGVFWGSAGVFLTLLSNRGLGSNQVAFFNLGGAALFLFFNVLIRHGFSAFRLTRVSLPRLILTGFISEFLYDICYINSVRSVGVGVAAVLLYTSPIFTVLLARICFKEKITGQKVIAIALNIIGCVLAITGGNLSFEGLSALGVVLGIASGFIYGWVAILGKYNTSDTHPDVVTFYNFFFGFLFMCLLSRPWTFAAGTFRPSLILLGICCGTFGSGLPYLFFMQGMKRPVEAGKAPVFASLEPVVAMILGAVLFSESVNAVSFIGVIIIIVSIVIINGNKKTD
ncbi:MAG: EamA family transporter [Firmicutes bacterium]|nr:EamA family transporter [Bacillota bacterium]